MRELPGSVASALTDPLYRRQDYSAVDRAIEALCAHGPGTFQEFYRSYEGPFWSTHTGFELLDLCVGSPNIVDVTTVCRRKFGWPGPLLVLTEPLGGGVLVLNPASDVVFNVDFEGGDRDLLSGTLAPSFKSFYDFLDYYFRQG